MFVCAEDWFFHSHFLPLVKAARRVDEKIRIVLVTNTGAKREAIERFGVETIPLDFQRGSLNPRALARAVLGLRRLIRMVRPDIIHFISLVPVLTGVLAGVGDRKTILHVTGLGTLAEGGSVFLRLLRAGLFGFLVRHVRTRKCVMLFENPDDVHDLRRHGLPADTDIAILGGAGVNPAQYPPLPDPGDDEVRVAFVGRLIASKGVDILVEAMGMPEVRKRRVRLEIHGEVDPGNPGAFAREEVAAWNRLDYVHWHGFTTDILQVWRRAAICAVPTRTREGMPRAMLEAAACARPLVVTDVPGCRHFVRNGKEGFVVPPEDPKALAGAIARLASDRHLRVKMGQLARQRVMKGFSEEHIISRVSEIYRKLLKA